MILYITYMYEWHMVHIFDTLEFIAHGFWIWTLPFHHVAAHLVASQQHPNRTWDAKWAWSGLFKMDNIFLSSQSFHKNSGTIRQKKIAKKLLEKQHLYYHNTKQQHHEFPYSFVSHSTHLAGAPVDRSSQRLGPSSSSLHRTMPSVSTSVGQRSVTKRFKPLWLGHFSTTKSHGFKVTLIGDNGERQAATGDSMTIHSRSPPSGLTPVAQERMISSPSSWAASRAAIAGIGVFQSPFLAAHMAMDGHGCRWLWMIVDYGWHLFAKKNDFCAQQIDVCTDVSASNQSC